MTANPLKGEVSRVIAGETYTLLFSIDVLCAVEDRFDKGIAQLAAIILRTQRLGIVRALLHAGLAAHHPQLTEAQAGELIVELKIPDACDWIAQGLKVAFGDDDEGEAAPQARPGPQGRPARA